MASRRLSFLQHHLSIWQPGRPGDGLVVGAVPGGGSAAETAAAPSLSAQAGRTTAHPSKKLDDHSMLKFIQDGYVLLHPELPSNVSRPEETPISYNEMICDKVNKLQEQGRDTGNNLLPQLPELMTLFDHPIIHGALQSILGNDYYIHLHHATHTKRGIEEGLGQRHHKDSVGNSRYCVDSKRRHHRTRWLMLLYFPQNTPVELGPTAIMPGSQYLLQYDMRAHGMNDVKLNDELPCAGPAGTVCIIHYDTLHRAMASKLDQTRHMLKFIVCRMSEPTLGDPSWDHDPSFSAGDGWPNSQHPQRLIQGAVWNWHLGQAATPSTFGPSAANESASVSELAAGLRSEDELTALNSAYSLAQRGGEEAANALVAALPETTPAQKDWSGNGNGACHCQMNILQHSNRVTVVVPLLAATCAGIGGTDTATSAGYGLSNMNDGSSVRALQNIISKPTTNGDIRARAIDALADSGLSAAAALPELISALDDSAADIRRRAAEALGLVAQGQTAEVTSRLASRLAHMLAVGDETQEVKREAALSIARLATDGEGVVDALTGVLLHPNGHVKGYAVKALDRIGTPAAMRAALDHLLTVRYA